MKSYIVMLLLAIGLFCAYAPSISKFPVQRAVTNTDSSRDQAKKDKMPKWLKKLINELKVAPPANPPSRIIRYKYRNEFVYYQPPECCDRPSQLFDGNGKLICLPSGGRSGGGDGKCPDFFNERKEEKMIWEDKRKRG